MRVDLYTKAILTVIACCLLYLCFVSRPQSVHAQVGEHVIVDNQYLPVSLVGVNQDSYHPFYVPVTIAGRNVPVAIVAVGDESISSAVPVANWYNLKGEAVPLTVQGR